jgi:hypothetical protein
VFFGGGFVSFLRETWRKEYVVNGEFEARERDVNIIYSCRYINIGIVTAEMLG